MNRLESWLHDWDWRPLARLFVWIGLTCAVLRYYRVSLPDPAAVLRELILGWLLTFGLLTWLQVLLLMSAWCLFLKLDDWSYAAAEWIVRSVAGRASFALNFTAALLVQIALVCSSSMFLSIAGRWAWLRH
jgi:hypothetical protein